MLDKTYVLELTLSASLLQERVSTEIHQTTHDVPPWNKLFSFAELVCSLQGFLMKLTDLGYFAATMRDATMHCVPLLASSIFCSGHRMTVICLCAGFNSSLAM